MSGLGTKLRAIFAHRQVPISTDTQPDDQSANRSSVQPNTGSNAKSHTTSHPKSHTGHSVIDTRAVIAIRWLALAGQTIALVIVAFGFSFAGAFQSAFGLVAVGAAINLWQSWRSRYQTVTSRPELLLALSFDVIQLSGLLYLTGGMANPFAMLLLAPIVVSAALLDFRATVYLVLLVAFCAIMITHFYLPLPFSETDFVLPALYLSGLFTALLVSSVFIGFYVWYLADKARQANAALAAMQLLLERDRRATVLGSLAAAAAHKLGSPLNTIAVISHDMKAALKGKIDGNDEILQDVRLLNAEVERCRTILTELDRDAQTENLARDVALPVSQMIRALLDPKLTELYGRVRFNTHASGEIREPHAKPLPDLKYALETLLDNADDFAASYIDVTIGWSDEAIEIEISDDGPGFTPAVLSRFGQPWNSSREGSDGHKGLGLFLAMTLIEGLGGQMSIANEDGAKIIIHLPCERLL